MRLYRDWGIYSYEEHKLLVLADKIYRKQHPERVKDKPTEYTIKPPVLHTRKGDGRYGKGTPMR